MALFQRMQGNGVSQPEGARQLVTQLQSRLQAVMPRFRELLNQPGATEIRAELTKGLVERSMARAIKLVFNQSEPTPQLKGGGVGVQRGLPPDTMPPVQRRATPARQQGALPAGVARPVQRPKQWFSAQQITGTG